MTTNDSSWPDRSSAASGHEPSQRQGEIGVLGNERLTALAGAVLLVLIAVEVATVSTLRALLSVHVFVGVLLVGPLAVKFGSTGYRFVRYYTGSPAYLHKGPPQLTLRVLAPLLVASTLAVISSGIALVVVGPPHAGLLLPMHVLSALFWLPVLAIHAYAYIRRVPTSLAEEWSNDAAVQVWGRQNRLGVNMVALLGGLIAAAMLLPVANPWVAWMDTHGAGPGFFIVGMTLVMFALLFARALSVKGKP